MREINNIHDIHDGDIISSKTWNKLKKQNDHEWYFSISKRTVRFSEAMIQKGFTSVYFTVINSTTTIIKYKLNVIKGKIKHICTNWPSSCTALTKRN